MEEKSAQFRNIKQQYEKQREKERIELAKYLSADTEITAKGIRVLVSGKAGKGIQNYTSGNRIFPYDLRNWKWVELEKEGTSFNCIISLNMPEGDPNTANTHCLYDRISISVSYKIGESYCMTNIYTDVELPLTDTDLKKLAGIIIKQFEFFCKLGEDMKPL